MSRASLPIEEGSELQGAGADEEQAAASARWLATLRLLLLPIVFAGDRLVAHPTVGTAGFNVVFAIACVYAIVVWIGVHRRRLHPPLRVITIIDFALVCGLTYESGGAFSQLHWAFLFLPLGAAILLDPRRTAEISAVTAAAYLVVATTHPSTHSQQIDLILVQGFYIVWIGATAVALSTLLARRQARIRNLAAERGNLVTQALAAEDRARRRLVNELHDSAIQDLLAARQDLAEARHGDETAVSRANNAIGLALDQLRAIVRDLHPYGLEQLGLEAALETIAEQQASRGGYRVSTHIENDAVGVSDVLVVSLARELLANATRHASPSHVRLRLESRARSIMLTVTDDGSGFERSVLPAALRHGHIGLASCRERLQGVTGLLEIETAPGRGTTVRCVIPRAPSDRRGRNRTVQRRSFKRPSRVVVAD